jgi:hypothetical protein
MPGNHSVSAMEIIKTLFTLGWYGTPQALEKALEKAPAMRVPRAAGKRMQFLEKYIPLPRKSRLDDSQPVFNVLCEDAIMFYTVRCSSIRKSRT